MKGGLEFAQALDLAMVGGGLPAFLLHELQGITRRHAIINQHCRGQ